MADGMLLDVADASIEYSYDVRGVGYTAHQDITTLQEHLPELRLSVSRPVGIKYDPGAILCQLHRPVRRVERTAQRACRCRRN